MYLRKLFLAVSFSVILASGLALNSYAALIGNWGTLTQGYPFSYVSTPYVSTAYTPANTLFSGDATVVFTFDGSGDSYFGHMQFNATPDLLSLTGGNAYPVSSGNYDQMFIVNSLTIKTLGSGFTSALIPFVCPVGLNILSMTSSNSYSSFFSTAGYLDTPVGGAHDISFKASTQEGAIIHYTSDILPQVQYSTENAYSFEGLTRLGTDVYPSSTFAQGFQPFTATMNAHFDYFTVPEPGVLGMLLGAGVGGSMFCFKLRRRS